MTTLLDGLRHGDGQLGAAAPPQRGMHLGGQGDGFGVFGGLVPGEGGAAAAAQALRITTVYACVNLIAQTVASLPRKVIRRGDKSRVPVRDEAFRHVWGRPNAQHLGTTTWTTFMASLLLQGDGFLWKDRDPSRPSSGDLPNELWSLRPERVRVTRTDEGVKVFRLDNQPALTFDASMIGHVPALSPDGLRGIAPIEAAAMQLGAVFNADKTTAAFFKRGMTMSGVLQAKDMISQQKAQELKDRWKENVAAGAAGVGEIAVLDNGAEFKPIMAPFEQFQFVEYRTFTREDIVSIFRCPPTLIGLGGADSNWGTGVEQRGIHFVTYTLMPWLTSIEELINAELLDPDLEMKFAVNGLLRGDMKSRAEFYTKMRDGGFFSADDVLEIEDMPPRPIGDDYVLKSGFMRIPVETGALEAPSPSLPQPPSGNGAALETVVGDVMRRYEDQVITDVPSPVAGLLAASFRNCCPRCDRLVARGAADGVELRCERCRETFVVGARLTATS